MIETPPSAQVAQDPQKKPDLVPWVPSPVPTTLELESYKILATLFNSEETSFWTRNNILVAVHGALIAATAAILGGAEKVLGPGAPPIAAKLMFGSLAALAFVGLLMAVAWLYMAGRSERIADTISSQLKKIEENFANRAPMPMGPDFQAFITFGNQLDPKSSENNLSKPKWNNSVRLSSLWQKVGWGLATLWLLLSFVFIAFAIVLTPLPSETSALRLEVESAALRAEGAAISALKAAAVVEAAASAVHTRPPRAASAS